MLDALNPKVCEGNFVSGPTSSVGGGSIRLEGSQRHPLSSPSADRDLRSPDSDLLRPVSFPTAGGDVKYQTGVDWIREQPQRKKP